MSQHDKGHSMQTIRFDLSHSAGRLKVQFTAGQVKLMAQVDAFGERSECCPHASVLALTLKPVLERFLALHIERSGGVKGFKDAYLEAVFDGASSILFKQNSGLLASSQS